ncbi:MAG: secondary thiamine-phosphate synthase enzyme YjbQ [Armatimonadota bacterium]|nr:secondary thiamine-phosphate synthase enzyme YjbQ [Armatimonadota bacterium]
MAVRWHTVYVTSTRQTQMLDVTEEVSRVCQDAPGKDGLLFVYCPHTTAGVIIQEAERGLLHDLEAWLARAVPQQEGYHHDRVDDNAASHLRAAIAGAGVVVPVRAGRPALGTWQRILFAELDGPRSRHLEVGVLT